MDKDTPRYEYSSYFAKRFKELMSEKNLKVSDIARGCKMSHSIVSNILNVHRAPSSDFIFSVAHFLDVPYEDIAYMTVNEEGIQYDENSQKYIPLLILNNGRGPTVGEIKTISESELMNFYGAKYDTDSFTSFVKKYMRDKLYKDRYEEYRKSIDKHYKNTLVKSITSKLSEMDEDDLSYINAQIDLYMKHKNK